MGLGINWDKETKDKLLATATGDFGAKIDGFNVYHESGFGSGDESKYAVILTGREDYEPGEDDEPQVQLTFLDRSNTLRLLLAEPDARTLHMLLGHLLNVTSNAAEPEV
jgi:hypothetical protein